jgi:hypothetical protein
MKLSAFPSTFTLVFTLLALPILGCVPEALAPGGGDGVTGGSFEQSPQKRRLVHVDHVDPAKAALFEDARRQLLAAYAAKGLHEGTTVLIETKDDDGRPEFLSLRPFGAYAEIDKLNDAAAARASALGKDLDRLDAMTHATLVPPHANEIWLLHADLSYAPTGPAPAPSEVDATAARLTFEEVAPTAADEYEAAVKGVTLALARAKVPVTRLAFTSSYGTGEYVTVWLARSASDLEALGGATQPEVATALEKERAKTGKSTTRVAFVRRELSTR